MLGGSLALQVLHALRCAALCQAAGKSPEQGTAGKQALRAQRGLFFFALFSLPGLPPTPTVPLTPVEQNCGVPSCWGRM